MGTPSSALYSPRTPLSIHYSFKSSARHFNKHLVCTPHSPISSTVKSVKLSTFPSLVLNSDNFRRGYLLKPVKCAITDNPSSNFSFHPQFVVDFMEEKLYELTPYRVFKWMVIAAISVTTLKWVVNFVSNPMHWVYFSWTWLFWPRFVAIGAGLYGIHCFRKHLRGESSISEQIAIVTSTFLWLTLVPPGYFNGYLEGWPFVFFFVYHYFFFFNVSIRTRLYGDCNARPHDPKWDVNVPTWYRVLFAVGVNVGHWLAAFEGQELQKIPGGWSSIAIWVLIIFANLMHYNASLYLANYSEKVVVPTAVVQFGPYRWVRHPIYVSIMLLFVTYFVSLRAPLSCLYIIAVCVLYYAQKVKLEEALMVETFGEMYLQYASKVRYKLIPFIY